MSKKTVLELGSYSSGTMREEDLIPTFLFACRGLRMSRADRKTVTEIRRSEAKADYYENELLASEDLQTLFDILNNYTPNYCYFGAHPGDGADYGVWVVEDLLDDTRQGSYDGMVFRGNREDCPRTMRDTNRFDYCLEVNDHSNATLYRRVGKRNQWREVWSIV